MPKGNQKETVQVEGIFERFEYNINQALNDLSDELDNVELPTEAQKENIIDEMRDDIMDQVEEGEANFKNAVRVWAERKGYFE